MILFCDDVFLVCVFGEKGITTHAKASQCIPKACPDLRVAVISGQGNFLVSAPENLSGGP